MSEGHEAPASAKLRALSDGRRCRVMSENAALTTWRMCALRANVVSGKSQRTKWSNRMEVVYGDIAMNQSLVPWRNTLP
jgi:hypothetical protein